MSLMDQVKKGVLAGYHVWQANSEADDANQKVDEAVTSLRSMTDAALKIEAALAAFDGDPATAVPVASTSA